MIAAADTPLMLMDELMNGLDVANVSLISKRLIQMKAEGKLIFVASHLLTNLDLYADRVLYLKDGNIIHEQNAVNAAEKFLKIDLSPEEYEKLSLTCSFPENHLYIANHLCCISINLLQFEPLS